MSWFTRLEHRLSSFGHEIAQDVSKIGSEVVRVAKDVFHAAETAVVSVVQNVPDIALKSLEDTYEQLIGNDLKVLRDPSATKLAKVEAALDLASNFTMPAEKIPMAIGEVALKNLIAEGETTAIAAALKSLQASGDSKALVGAELALLKTAASIGATQADAAQLQTQLATIQAAVAAGTDLPASAKTAITEVAAALTGPGSFKDRIASLHAAIGSLSAAVADIQALQAGASGVGGAFLPAAPAAPAVPQVTTEHGLTVVTSKDTILALQDGSTLTSDIMRNLKAEQAAHPDKKLYVVGKDLDAAATAQLKAAGIAVAGAHQIADVLSSSSAKNASPASVAWPTSPASPAHVPSDADVVKETLAKLSPETIQRIQRGGRSEVGMPHLEATPWDGKGQIGSVTSVIGARVEQYTGKGWTTYDAAQLAPLQAQLAANEAAQDPTLVTKISPGDELRVGSNGSIELIPRDPQNPGLKAVSVSAAGQTSNIEPSALQRN